MPIVFVHGVNNRKQDPDYESGNVAREAFFRRILAPGIELTGDVKVLFPYWGDQGVQFRWNQASLPDDSQHMVALGIGSDAARIDLGLAEIRTQAGAPVVSFGAISRTRSFTDAIDLVWDTASVLYPGNAAQVLDHYQAALRYAAANPAPNWALQDPPLDNAVFVDRLLTESAGFASPAVAPEVVALGLGDWLANIQDGLKEAASRLGHLPGGAASSIATSLGRKKLHASASRFLGDIFVYLTSRDATGPDALLADLLARLDEADKARKPGDEKLIVVGHSLGGLLAYDVFTHYRPDLQVDCFVTVGSQVALFQEMSLCKDSAAQVQAGVPSDPEQDRIARPANIAQWINVFDTNDIFSFSAAGVYAGVDDYRYDTGYGSLEAHGGYFARPSFYRRLAARISGKG